MLCPDLLGLGGGRVVGSAWKVMAAVEEIMIVKITARRGRVALHALAWSLGQVGAA